MTPAVAQGGWLYGGFANPNDATPKHMWFEYNDYLYDTMPGSPIRRIAANEWIRRRPPSEGQEFPPNRVGRIAFSLSATQHHIVTDGTIIWTAATVAGRIVHEYLPPN